MADLLDFMLVSSDDKQAEVIETYKSASRYLYDLFDIVCFCVCLCGNLTVFYVSSRKKDVNLDRPTSAWCCFLFFLRLSF